MKIVKGLCSKLICIRDGDKYASEAHVNKIHSKRGFAEQYQEKKF